MQNQNLSQTKPKMIIEPFSIGKNRLINFDRENWRGSYKALILLEHLLTHGPLSVALEFQDDKDTIKNMGSFQHIDEKGFVFVFSIWSFNFASATQI